MTFLQALRAPHNLHVTPPRTRPFLKWAGGKFRVLEQILPNLPACERLLEPFAGSAAVSLNSGVRKAVVSDLNADIINLYTVVRDDLECFVSASRDTFIDGKASFARTFERSAKAAFLRASATNTCL